MKTNAPKLLSLVLLTLTLTFNQTQAVPGGLDLSFDPGSSVNGGGVFAIALQADGRVLLGGNFTTVHGAMRRGLARLNADGSTDPTFAVAISTVDSWIATVAVQSDQKIIVGGGFTSINGVARNGLARLNPDGSLDLAFNPTLVGYLLSVQAVALQADGQIVIAGSFTSVNGAPRNHVARLNSDGTLDTNFLAALDGANDGVLGLALDDDGRIVIGGVFTSVNGVARNRIARLNPDGSLDLSFLQALDGPNALVRYVVLDDQGRVMIGGDFTGVNQVPIAGIARLNPNGSLDNSFASSLGASQPEVRAVAVQSDGKVLIGGTFQFWPQHFLRLNSDGSVDNSFLNGAPADDYVFAIYLQGSDKILVGGWFHGFGHIGRPCVARLNVDGTMDPAFVNGPVGPSWYLQSLALQSNGKVLIGGIFQSVNEMPCSGLARLNADGTLDGSFLPQTSPADFPGCIVLQSDGRILIGGHGQIVRLKADGSPDTTFAASVNGYYLNSLALQPDGRILIAGQFTAVNGVAHTNLARLNPNGSLDFTFLNGGRGPNGGVGSMALQGDGKVLLGGGFTAVNGVTRNRIARLNPDGSLDASFTADVDGMVSALALQTDGKVVLGGSFHVVNGAARNLVARLNADGSLDTSFQDIGNAVNYVYCLAIQGDGRILVGGMFGLLAGVPRSNLMLLNTDGSVDGTFAPDLGGQNGWVKSIVFQSDGSILIGGGFVSVDGVPRSYVARLSSATRITAPGILVPPQSQTAEPGSTPRFTLRAAGSPPLGYLWFFNGTTLTGCGTNSNLQLTNVQPSHSGAYTVVVTNAAGAVTSPPAMLAVIAPVERRPVAGISLIGEVGSPFHLEYADALPPTAWLPLDTITLASSPQWFFDSFTPLPPQRFYRAWQPAPALAPSLQFPSLIPALTLTGTVGTQMRVDAINAIGSTGAWFTLATVTLTNSTQYYFDTTAPGQRQRLYRLVPAP